MLEILRVSLQDRRRMPPDSTLPLAHWSLFRCQLRWAYERLLSTEPRKRMPYISSPVAAWLIRSGSITLRFESGEERFGPGTWVFPKEAEGVQEFSQEGVQILSLRFQAEWSYGTPIFDRSRTVTIAAEAVPQLTESAVNLVRFVRDHFPGQLTSLKLEGGFDDYLRLQPLFMQWIAVYRSALTAYGVRANTVESLDDKIRLALQIIETQPLSVPLRETALARAAGCSVSQLNKLFGKQTGSTPAALWNRRKLSAAQSQLLNSRESVKAIAYHLGFSAPEHFTHWFRKHSELSPLGFRRLHQSGEELPL